MAHDWGLTGFLEIIQSSHGNQNAQSMACLKKMKHKYHRIQKFHFWLYTQKICKQNFRQVHSKVHSSSDIHGSPQVATTPTPIEG